MAKTFSLFLNFDGECREAMEFYAKVFGSKVEGAMTYADAPENPEFPTAEADVDRIMYAGVEIFGMNVMFCDMPSGSGLAKGDNISPTLGSDDEEEIRRVYDALKEGGEVGMELQKTFFSELYGMVTDKYGITWQLTCDCAME